MNLKEEKLSLKRIQLLLKRDIFSEYRSSLIVIGSLIALLLSFDILTFTLFNQQASVGHHTETVSIIILIGGVILTSTIFKEVHKRESAQSYLMLPASPLEKALSRILISNVGWVLLTLIWYSLYSYISAGITELISGQHHFLFNPFHKELWTAIAHYFVLQSFFLVGAVYFRKNHLFKTLLSLFAIGVIISIIMAFSVRLIFAPYFSGFFVVDNPENIGPLFERLPFKFSGQIDLLKGMRDIIYWGLIAPVGWIITYIRFREVQVKDAV